MSQVAASASSSEKKAISPSAVHGQGPPPKLRSCVVCRNRKVRCDKQSPCSNCRSANIACVFPPNNRPPRWARRLERATNNATSSSVSTPQDADPGVAKVMDRLQNLESLVGELRSQLGQVRVPTSLASVDSSMSSFPEGAAHHDDPKYERDTSPIATASNLQKQFGRLVVQDTSNSRYISSGFWSRVSDELDGLKMDTRSLAEDDVDSSDDEVSFGRTPSSTQELDRTPSERHAFLFGHNLSTSASEIRDLHPLPSHVPFLLDVFSENVNFIIQIVHMPTVIKMARDLRGSGVANLTPSNEALLFSMYYAAITSMEEEDVINNFGSTKSELSQRYRLGLEYALAKADFLNAPDITLVQAFAIFLGLVRRHDSPRFVWMMTGLVIRMAQYLGLQRDGAHFPHLTPYEIEIRRKVWWAVCSLDLRASEDQGTELTIMSGSFDTKIPSNINDTDISPETEHMPKERDGVTDISFARICAGTCEIMREMMSRGVLNRVSGLEDQSRLLNEIYQKYEEGYLQHTSADIVHWVAVTIARLVMAKMTLIVFLPVLFSSGERISEEIRTKFLIAAIEVAEYNHELNAEQQCRQWRWVYQTYTHWHAIVYLMIEISRRPWSAIVERAWVALHSKWLIPAQSTLGKNMRIWVPLRKLMDKARTHREAELERLRSDPQAADRLELEDQKIPLPSSSGLFPAGSSADTFRKRWRQLVAKQDVPDDSTNAFGSLGTGASSNSLHTMSEGSLMTKYTPAHSPSDLSHNTTFEPVDLGKDRSQNEQISEGNNIRASEPAVALDNPNNPASAQAIGASVDLFPTVPSDSSDSRTMGANFVPWLWSDAEPLTDTFPMGAGESVDIDMNLDGDMNWYNWVQSATGLERDAWA